ncbi:MAG: hypothetical protein Q4A11_01980 [Brachymonas sp.]|nr:hypothetical protein [Brachymonas sp.]
MQDFGKEHYLNTLNQAFASYSDEQMAALKVTDESKARAIESMVSNNQAMKVKLYAFFQDADPSIKKLKAEILHMTVSSKNGKIYL